MINNNNSSSPPLVWWLTRSMQAYSDKIVLFFCDHFTMASFLWRKGSMRQIRIYRAKLKYRATQAEDPKKLIERQMRTSPIQFIAYKTLRPQFSAPWRLRDHLYQKEGSAGPPKQSHNNSQIASRIAGVNFPSSSNMESSIFCAIKSS